jgi:hypothetical protein
MTTPIATLPAASPRIDLDNLLRRELKVGDPSDPQQVAQALSQRYQGDLRTQAIEGEARGLPFLRTPTLRTDAPPPTATSVDLDQAKHDVTQDLRMLIADNLTKDIRPELEGWQQVIHRSIDEGVNASRFGLDPHQRDKAFAMRRQLGDYARLSRLVGALTPGLNRSFRNLAQSIDEASAVMLVLMGESMANLGFAGGRFLLQAPYSELQARRDAVLNALRQVDGVAAMVGQGNTWPRGLRAYRQLTTVLEARGQGDLRSLMNEAELSRTMDELVQLAGGNSPNGLRAIGATAWAPLARLHRFVQTTIRQVAPASPELATLHEALQLFIDGFVPAGGFRLLRIARPSVLNYGLYGPSRITAAEQRLIELVNRRGALARHLDCLTACDCDAITVRSQIVLDKLLYDIDRAIDYYCVGDADLGLPETRAAAYSYLIDVVVNTPLVEPLFATAPVVNGAPVAINHVQINAPWPWAARGGMASPAYLATFTAPAAGTLHALIAGELNAIRTMLRPTGALGTTPTTWATSVDTYQFNLRQNLAWLGGSVTTLRFAQAIHDELCLQRDNDLQWRTLVEQVTAGCVSADAIFDASATANAGCLPLALDRALALVEAGTAQAIDFTSTLVPTPSLQVNATCNPLETIVPPHFEESLEDVVDRLTT